MNTDRDALRRAFRVFNHYMVLLWRLGLGGALNRGPRIAGRYMVLVHRGRRTGLMRRTPVNVAVLDGDPHCVAGFGRGSDWYRNVVADPNVECWLSSGRWRGRAEEVTDAERRLAAMRAVMRASGFAARFDGIDADRMTDDELAARTETYPVLRIRLIETLTGPGGPGDLRWVWPAGGGVAAAMLAWRRLTQPKAAPNVARITKTTTRRSTESRG